jgi:hypothetical protein
VNGLRVVALFHWSKDRGREALQTCNKLSLFCPALLWRDFRIRTIPLWPEDRTCLDFSRKGAEIPTFFFYSGFLPHFKHPALGQVVPQIRGTLSIGIILASKSAIGPLDRLLGLSVSIYFIGKATPLPAWRDLRKGLDFLLKSRSMFIGLCRHK